MLISAGKTLAELRISSGAKLMLVGTKMQGAPLRARLSCLTRAEVLQVSSAEEKAEHAPPPPSDKAQEEALLFDPADKARRTVALPLTVQEHKKILEQGPPLEAMPGVTGRHDRTWVGLFGHAYKVAIPPRGITGVSDKVVVGKLRLTLKTESDVCRARSTDLTWAGAVDTVGQVDEANPVCIHQ